MAWLLHEPRLRAEVPVFCIVGLRPLLRNVRAPVTVSMGAVQLLLHLHTRLEVFGQLYNLMKWLIMHLILKVLIKNEVKEPFEMEYEKIDMDDEDEGETPLLWEVKICSLLRC
jgi:hypothetical protein